MLNSVSHVMSTNCVTAAPQDHLQQIAIQMRDHDIGFVPVLEGQKLMGVITDRDLVIRGYAENRPGTAPAQEVMSPAVITVSPQTSVDEAAQMMADSQIRRLAVVDQGNLIGVVAIGDLAVRTHFQDEAGEALGAISSDARLQ